MIVNVLIEKKSKWLNSFFNTESEIIILYYVIFVLLIMYQSSFINNTK